MGVQIPPRALFDLEGRPDADVKLFVGPTWLLGVEYCCWMATEQGTTVRPIRMGPMTINVRIWVYGTVTLMSVLAVFEGWTDLSRVFGVVLVVVGPMLALVLAHLFAEVLEFQIRAGHAPSAMDWRHMGGQSAQFLLVGLPPLAVFFVLIGLFKASIATSIIIMLYFGVISLGFWGWIAGRRSGYRGWRLIGAALAGFLIGFVVICLQLLLKPH